MTIIIDNAVEDLLSLHAFAVYPAAMAACKTTAVVSPLQATFSVRTIEVSV